MRLLFIALVMPLSVFAEDWTVGYKTYRNVKVSKVEPDGVRIMHDAGGAKIPMEKVPAEFRSRYDFDEDKANAFREKKSAEMAKAEEEKKVKMEAEKAARSEKERQKQLEKLQPITMTEARNAILASAKAALPRELAASYPTKLAEYKSFKESVDSGVADRVALYVSVRRNAQIYELRDEAEKAKEALREAGLILDTVEQDLAIVSRLYSELGRKRIVSKALSIGKSLVGE